MDIPTSSNTPYFSSMRVKNLGFDVLGCFTATAAILAPYAPEALPTPPGELLFLTAGIMGAGACIAYAAIDLAASDSQIEFSHQYKNVVSSPAGLFAALGASAYGESAIAPAADFATTLYDVGTFTSHTLTEFLLSVGTLVGDLDTLRQYMPPQGGNMSDSDLARYSNALSPLGSPSDPYLDVLSPGDLTTSSPYPSASPPPTIDQPQMPPPEQSPGGPATSSPPVENPGLE